MVIFSDLNGIVDYVTQPNTD